ncbi:hypothetical protein ACHAXR_006841 [Thalassiosira sp. AJA248-18]
MTMQSSLCRGLGHCRNATSIRPPRRHCSPSRILSRGFSAPILCNGRELTTTTTTQSRAPHFFVTWDHHRRRLSTSSSSNQTPLEQRRHAILTQALQRVHDEGWTDDAIASGTLDAGLPPSYIGQASSATSPFGSADLVAFFMDECNGNLRKQLAEDQSRQQGEENGVSSRIHKALQIRLSMVLPFVTSNRWHEGMAIGALPQNAYRTAQQLNDMASIVLDYALGKENANNTTQRAAIVAAYAAAELHLLSDGNNYGTVSGNSLSLSGERYHATWSFLEARSTEVARLIVDGPNMPSINGVPLPNRTHVVAASAVVSSLAGAVLSLAAPSAAAVAGHVFPRAMSSVLTPLQNAVGSQMNTNQGRDGTKPSDYAVVTDTLPPFDASEEIFPESKR